ncbi:hypothetical protein [Microvirga massiliensis]|uniref:hypothetical protein n=1 Tax=Microvirga massiliensis TaxID=1033741 RepID=UPI0006608D0D|nr:hypothetical protein [Microvirga massiliensis]
MQSLLEERMVSAMVREERLKAASGLRHIGLLLTSWRGRSGQRYVVGVHSLSDEASVLGATEAIMLAVRRMPGGDARILEAVAIGASECEARNAEWLARARDLGATEIHIHRLADDAGEREAIVRDLMRGGRRPRQRSEV